MAQSGLHGLIGGYAARVCVKAADTPAGVSRAKGLKFGLVLGALIPDVDFFVLGPLFLVNSRIALTMHRSFTHSILTTAVVVALTWLLASGQRRDYLRGFAVGLGLGILTHLVADVILWFGGIQVLWPLGYVGIHQELNLWAHYQPPRVVSNLLGALDYVFFGLYYLWLASAARKAGTDTGFLNRLRLLTNLQWVLAAVFVALAVYLSAGGMLFDIAHYAMFILFFFPMCLYVTVKMRETIHAL
ncbi:MAG: metal-dependent hydrolase [Bacillota bacterium]|nr:MAG: metal-dependent hydrolase [Bacillota bacterium]